MTNWPLMPLDLAQCDACGWLYTPSRLTHRCADRRPPAASAGPYGAIIIRGDGYTRRQQQARAWQWG